MARHESPRSRMTWAVVAMGVGLALLAGGIAWASHVSGQGRMVAGNVHYAGSELSGIDVEDAQRIVEQRADSLMKTAIIVVLENGEKLEIEAGEVGFSYDTEQVLGGMISARHTGGPISELWSWLSTPVSPVTIEDIVDFDPVVAEERLRAEERLKPRAPVEPRVTMREPGELVVIPGEPGAKVDVVGLVDQIATMRPGGEEITIAADSITIPPEVDDVTARELADALNTAIDDDVEVLVDRVVHRVPVTELRSRLGTHVSDGQLVVTFDTGEFRRYLETAIPAPVSGLRSPILEVVDEQVVTMRPGRPPQICCEAGSVRAAIERIRAGAEGPIRIDPRDTENPKLLAWSDGSAVSEKVGEFTTHHPCCQGRVENIHRIADMVRGVYLLPGESLSLNDHVDARTRENGFVAAGAIRFGRLVDEVGGGVSQFATTIFNAAYFAGLDFDEYRSHSIYFSRYPFGREATISNPAPDLVLANTTAYPILIWTSYDDTSITVSIYSTRHIEVTEAEQRVSRRGLCTYVETDRVRTYPDGRRTVDTFEALYRPAEGIDCGGNRIGPPTGS